MKIKLPLNVRWIERHDGHNRCIFMQEATREIDIPTGVEYVAHFQNFSRRRFMADLVGLCWVGEYETEPTA
jgi:hypothetical protein